MRIILDLLFENDYHSCRCHMNPSSNSSHGTLSLIKLITCLATLVSSVVFFMSKDGRYSPVAGMPRRVYVQGWTADFCSMQNLHFPHPCGSYSPVAGTIFCSCKNCISTILGGHAKEGICPGVDGRFLLSAIAPCIALTCTSMYKHAKSAFPTSMWVV
jgi:hypothetical protein